MHAEQKVKGFGLEVCLRVAVMLWKWTFKKVRPFSQDFMMCGHIKIKGKKEYLFEHWTTSLKYCISQRGILGIKNHKSNF